VRLLIKAVIFDFGGVVFKEVMKFVYEETGRKFDIDQNVVREKARPLIKQWQKNRITSEQFWKQLALELNIKNPKLLEDVWDRTFIQYSVPNEKTVEIVKRLKSGGYKVAALSNTVEPHANHHKKRKDYDLFFPVFLSYELGMSKPDKEIYEHVIKVMGVKFEECIFIDDKEINLETAKALGMKTILFRSAEQLEEDLRKVL